MAIRFSASMTASTPPNIMGMRIGVHPTSNLSPQPGVYSLQVGAMFEPRGFRGLLLRYQMVLTTDQAVLDKLYYGLCSYFA